MRIELKDENQEEPQKIDENDIRYKHETDLTKKEKRELEKMKLASMGWKGKLQYIWAYYKPQMAAIVAVIAIAFFVKDLYENSRIHTALTVMVIDSYGTKQEEAEEKVQKALGIQDDPYEIVTVDESLHWNPTARWPLPPKYLPGQWMCLLVPKIIWTVLSSKMSILWI